MVKAEKPVATEKAGSKTKKAGVGKTVTSKTGAKKKVLSKASTADAEAEITAWMDGEASATVAKRKLRTDDPLAAAPAKKLKRLAQSKPLDDSSSTDESVPAAVLQLVPKKKKMMEKTAAAEEPDETAAETIAVDASSEGEELALSSFRLSPSTCDALRARGITALFPIQAATFKRIYDGTDLIGRARTGSGKTLAFALPIVERVRAAREQAMTYGRKPCALIMAPTRELAQQVASEFESIAAASKLVTLCVYGGTQMGPSCNALRSGIDILVGTPGRIKDLAERGVLGLESVAFATLDEADQMLDMGFAEDMQEILGQCTNESRQTCLFSATLPPWVRQVAPTYMKTKPTIVDLVGDSAVKASTDVRHLAIGAPGPVQQRAATINDVISMYASSTGKVIIFCDTKAECDALSTAEELKLEAKCLHGDVPQATREKVMKAFRDGRFRVLIATDVAARGLDMIVELVVQVKPPVKRFGGREDTETYVHRSGRTGRAGRKGICVTLVGPRDRTYLSNIERSIGNAFEWLGAPNPTMLLQTAAATAATDAMAIGPDVCLYFAEAAAELLAEKAGDAASAIAAALALATGTTRPPKERSLITHQDGFATFHATMRSPVWDSSGERCARCCRRARARGWSTCGT